MAWHRLPVGAIASIAILAINNTASTTAFSVVRETSFQSSSPLVSQTSHKPSASDFNNNNNDRRSFLVKSSAVFVSILGLMNGAPFPAMATVTTPANITTTVTPSSSTSATSKPAVPANNTSSSSTVSSSSVVSASNQTAATAVKSTTSSALPTTLSPPVSKVGSTTLPTNSKVIPANPGDIKNCPDFATYDEAKKWFDTYYPYYGDVAKLDGNNDGIPCENLPGAPSKK